MPCSSCTTCCIEWCTPVAGHKPLSPSAERRCMSPGDSLCMEILNAAQQLHKASAGVCFVVAPPLQQRVQQLPAG